MATTVCQLECEDWVRLHWLPERYGQAFYRERLRLESGGFFDFDAVSADRQIAANISTSGACTASGKRGAGKLAKLRADMLFLMMAQVARRVLVLTERDMYERCVRERGNGRVPTSVEIVHAPLPAALNDRLTAARDASSSEVSPARPTEPSADRALWQRIREATPPNSALIGLAKAHAPPASWAEEDVDPFQQAEGA